MVGKVQGSVVLPITNERIELSTISDVKYVKYRLARLQLDYPEKFANIPKENNGDSKSFVVKS